MIVHEFNVRWTLGGPAKAKPVLIVDPNAVLSFAVTLQRFQPVARWRAQELERFSSIQLRQLSRRSLENDCENRYLERVVGGQPSHQ